MNNLNEILKKVATQTDLPIKTLLGKSRLKEIVDARRLFYFIARNEGFTTTEIATTINKHHSNIVNATQSHKKKYIIEKYNEFYNTTQKEFNLFIFLIDELKKRNAKKKKIFGILSENYNENQVNFIKENFKSMNSKILFEKIKPL